MLSRLSLEVRLVVAICLCHGMIHVLEQILPNVWTQMEGPMALGDMRYGTIQAVFALLFGLGSLPVGYVADLLGARRTLLVGMSGCALTALWCGFSPSVTSLTWAMIGLGLFSSFYHPTGMSWVASSVKYRGKAFGYHGVAGNIGLAVGPLLAGGLASLGAGGWRMAFVVSALVTVGLVVLLWRTGLAVEAQRAAELTSTSASTSTEATVQPTISQFLRLASVPLVLILLNTMAFGVLYRGFLSYFPKLLAAHMTWTEGSGGWTALLTAIPFAVGIIGQLAGGYLTHASERVEWTYPLIFSFAALGCLLMASSYDAMFFIHAMLFNFILFFWQPINNVLVASYAPKGYVGTAYGVSFACQFGSGAIAPWIMSRVATALHLEATFVVLAAFCGAGLLSSVAVVRWRGSTTPALEWRRG